MLLAIVSLGVVGCDFSSIVPSSPMPIAIRILQFDGNLCLLGGFPHRLTIRIDPTAASQVLALDETGMRYRVWWPEGFRGGTADDPVVRDPRGLVVARDGEVLAIPVDGFPKLHGYSVCSGGDGVGPAIWVQTHSLSLRDVGPVS